MELWKVVEEKRSCGELWKKNEVVESCGKNEVVESCGELW